jgi:hypothetical protein
MSQRAARKRGPTAICGGGGAFISISTIYEFVTQQGDNYRRQTAAQPGQSHSITWSARNRKEWSLSSGAHSRSPHEAAGRACYFASAASDLK